MFYSKDKYYNSIDNCPIIIFHKCLKGDISGLCYKGKARVNDINQAWEKIFNEYIKEFGLNHSYKLYLKKMIKAVENYKLCYVDGQKDKKTMAKVYERQAIMDLGDTNQDNFNQVVSYMSKEMGFQVNTKEITVREFYSNLAFINGK